MRQMFALETKFTISGPLVMGILFRKCAMLIAGHSNKMPSHNIFVDPDLDGWIALIGDPCWME